MRVPSFSLALALAVLLLVLLSLLGLAQIDRLKGELSKAQHSAIVRDGVEAVGALPSYGADVEHMVEWLNDFYASADGLRRARGLWMEGHPDYVGLSSWAFDVYLPERMRGLSDAHARQEIVKAIRASAEWQATHHPHEP
jgi:hypothetical protein